MASSERETLPVHITDSERVTLSVHKIVRRLDLSGGWGGVGGRGSVGKGENKE